jgi:hypothetical protein
LTTSRDVPWAAGVGLAGALVCFAAIRVQRGDGIRPYFFQENFAPAVAMACGYGYRTINPAVAAPSLDAFLRVTRNDFDCSDLRPPVELWPVTWNATWFYLYATTAAVWRVTGISWTALDVPTAALGGLTTASLFAMFRFVARQWVAAAAAMVLTVSLTNLSSLMSLRDYSKAPFVLVATFLLTVVVAMRVRTRSLLMLSAAYGAVIGFGYGFRSDLLVMAPFGVLVLALLPPGPLRLCWRRNLAAAGLALAAFLIVAAPALRGLASGGCHYHYALLGLTTPMTSALGLRPSLYGLGDPMADTFVDLKVGDSAQRMFGWPPPPLCSATYDAASGDLFRRIAVTFPSDLVVRAYASALGVLRAGMMLPEVVVPRTRVAAAIGRLNRSLAALWLLGPIATALAAGVLWSAEPRLGVALVVFVLFLTGYPAIEFQVRHWFHLLFIPWWAVMLVIGRTAIGEHALTSRQWWTIASVSVALVLVLTTALTALRIVQSRRVASLIRAYETAPTEDLIVSRRAGSSVDVAWHTLDYGDGPRHRSSELLVLTVDPEACGGRGPIDVRVRYQADAPSHDMGTSIRVDRDPAGIQATRVFVPVFAQGAFEQIYLRFTGFDVPGRPADCISRVSRVADRARLPLWVQLQVPPDWNARPLYQRLPLRSLIQ